MIGLGGHLLSSDAPLDPASQLLAEWNIYSRRGQRETTRWSSCQRTILEYLAVAFGLTLARHPAKMA